MAAVGPFEGGPGKKQLIHVQRTFDRFAVGKPGDRSMNQASFQAFCEEMGMVNPGAPPRPIPPRRRASPRSRCAAPLSLCPAALTRGSVRARRPQR